MAGASSRVDDATVAQTAGAEAPAHSTGNGATGAAKAGPGAYAPQAKQEASPQLTRDGQDSLAPYQEQSEKNNPSAVPAQSTVPGYFIPRKRLLWCLVVTVVAIVAIALGVGLGVGLTRANSANSTSPSGPAPSSPPVGPGGNGTGNSTGTGNGNGNGTTSQGTPPSTIANDTSLASVETSDGSRHMFYQDVNGSIQHAVYSSSGSQWSIPLGELGVKDARNSTPMAAVSLRPPSSDDDIICLLYVSTNDSMQSIRFVEGAWQPYPMFTPLNISSDLRALSASTVPSMNNVANDNSLFVLTQRPGAGANLIYVTSNATQKSWTWKDLTGELNAANSTGHFAFNAPFAVASNVSGAFLYDFLSSNVDYPWVGVFANEVGDPSSNLVGAGYDGTGFGSASFGLNYNDLVPADSTSLPAQLPSTSYDLALAAIHGQLSILYVDNGQFVTTGEMNLNVGSVKNNTGSKFPFTRLSGYLSSGGLYYLYHQVDGSTIAEDVYDPEGSWTSSNVVAPG